MPKILALDTSTDACSVALYIDGDVFEDFRVIPRQHTQQLLPMVETLLSDQSVKIADLDALAFGRGPGSFAGIRIATGVTQGLAYAADLPVIPVSTLEALALAAHKQEGADTVVAALDARMDEIYVASYEMVSGLPVVKQAEHVISPALFELESDSCLGVGSGWRYFEDMSEAVRTQVNVSETDYYPSAAMMLTLAVREFENGNTVPAAEALPVYLRDEVAWKKKDQQ